MVIWTKPARDDLHAIFEYIALDSKFYAKNTIRNIIGRVMKLSETPMLGRIVPELDQDEVREVFVYSYRIICQLLSDNLAILAVVHGHHELKDTDIPVIG